MPYVILLAPASNRVYAGQSPRLLAAELAVLLNGSPGTAEITPTSIAGVDYLSITLNALDDHARTALGRLSGFLAAFRRDGDHLLPTEVARPDRFDDDLVTIPKYAGKTNEQLTRMLINITVASMERRPGGPVAILDPLCGRGTTLSTGLMLGYDVAGVESDDRAVEAYAAFLRSYLRRKRLKHSVAVSPVRRDGRSLGRRLDATISPPDGGPSLGLVVFTGDTRQSAALFGKRRFDAVVTDAPYGVVHGSRTTAATADKSSGRRRGGDSLRAGTERSAATLLAEALPVWAGQLKPGGALGVSWNTYAISRQRLVEIATTAGLRPLDDGPYRDFAHRVDSSIVRDILIAVTPSSGTDSTRP
jgi:hypothetical protein